MGNKRLLLTLYGRAGCHLCEEMSARLQVLQRVHGFRLETVDIDDVPELAARFGLVIPVLMAGEREISRFRLDEDLLTALLRTPDALV
jgi:Glutaredoxin-like domain (DUF836)